MKYFLLLFLFTSLYSQERTRVKEPELLLLNKYNTDKNVTGWYMSEKLDGVRAYWDEELLIDGSDCTTDYESITVAKPTFYDIKKLNEDIVDLINSSNQLEILKRIVPEFNHQTNFN